MAALTRERQPDRLGEEIVRYDHPIAANVKAWAGAIAVIDPATGLAKPAVTGTNLRTAGVFEKTYDNTGGAASAFRVAIRGGCFLMNNSTAGDLIAQVDVGKDCYLVDDQTVAKTDGTGTRSIAGKIQDVTAAGVFVHLRLR
jgi:hypothetical protein